MVSAVVVLRRGMNVPDDAYLVAVIAALAPEYAEVAHRVGLSQPTWFRNAELADSAAGDAARAVAARLSLDDAEYRYRLGDGPDGAPVMLVLVGG